VPADHTPPEPWPSFAGYLETVADERCRGPVFAEQLRGALEAARRDEWRWQDALSRSVTLVNDPDARGRDLLHLVKRVSQYRPATGPPPEWAEIRRAAEERRKDGSA
jgi:hypothetical protein